MGLRPAKSHEKLSGRRLADEILWGRLVTCGRLAIGPCRLRGGPAAVTNRRAGCQPAPHWFFAPVSSGRHRIPKVLKGFVVDHRSFARAGKNRATGPCIKTYIQVYNIEN